MTYDWKQEGEEIRDVVGDKLDDISLYNPVQGRLITPYEWRPEVLVQGVLNALGDIETLVELKVTKSESFPEGMLFANQKMVDDRLSSLTSEERLFAYQKLDNHFKMVQAYITSQSLRTQAEIQTSLDYGTTVGFMATDQEALNLAAQYMAGTNNKVPRLKGKLFDSYVEAELLDILGTMGPSQLGLYRKAGIEGRISSNMANWQRKVAEIELGKKLPERINPRKLRVVSH